MVLLLDYHWQLFGQFDAHKHAVLVFEPIDAVFVYSLKAPMPRRPTFIVGHQLREVVLAAVANHGYARKYASEELQEDPEVKLVVDSDL